MEVQSKNFHICRLCAQVTKEVIGIFNSTTSNIQEKINYHLPINVNENDSLPLTTCLSCLKTLMEFDQLVTKCIEASKHFQELEALKMAEDVNIPKDTFNAVVKLEQDEQILDDTPDAESDLENENGTNKKAKFRRKKYELEAKFFCDTCGKRYTRRFDLQKHERLKHKQGPLYVSPSQELLTRCKCISDARKLVYKCDVCMKIFTKSSNLLRHYTIHSKIKKFCCHICGQSFGIAESMRRHIKSYHEKIRGFSCNICEQSFASKQTLDEHINIHTDNRPFVCEVCGAMFRQRATLTTHKLCHYSDNYKFECNYCDKKYRTSSELTAHLRKHTGNKPFKCEICGMLFKYKNVMKRHVKIHDAKCDFMCDICGKNFTQERYLANHKIIHKYP